MEPIVSFQNVTKTYGDHVAVHSLDLDVDAGKFVTLLGPSGCGKTTTLRMLGGFERPSSGRIMLDRSDVTHLPPNRRNVNIVFQDYALFPHMTVAGNIAFGLELQGRDAAFTGRRVTELLDLVQLRDYAGRMPSELSGGQRQRVALIRALAPDPKVLLLDEPLSALDAKLRQQMQLELKSVQEKTGKTFIFVTHDQEEALTMSDQIVVMNGGKIEQMGDPVTLYERPASLFVANFIGETNLLGGEVAGFESGTAILDWAGMKIRSAFAAFRPAAGSRACAVLRPEMLHCSASEPATENRARGTVRQRVFRGNHTSLTVELAGGAILKAMVHAGAAPQLAGDELWVGWKADATTLIRA